MALSSVLLSVLSAAFTLLGVFAVVLPFAGSVLSFGAPALAVLGVILGGVAISRAREAGEGGSSLGLAGVIMNALVFVPALLGALTCGVCNALVSGAAVQSGSPNMRFQLGQGGGLRGLRGPPGADAGLLDDDLAPPPLRAPGGPDAGMAPPPSGSPPAFPAPPLSPGPGPRRGR